MTLKRERSFYYALGKFIVAYSIFEFFLNVSFSAFAKISPIPANAIKKGMTSKDLISIIRTLLEIGDYKENNIREIDKLFNHFEKITEFRNRLIHRHPLSDESTPDEYYVTNIATLNVGKNYEVMHFKLKDIKDATSDLQKMAQRIIVYASESYPGTLSKRVRSPFRYKPVPRYTPIRTPSSKIQDA